MKYAQDILDLVGQTPLVRLNRMVDESTMARVLVKMEQLNPAGSVKDRMAVHMLRRAEEHDLIGPGSTIVESTSGNTGLGLAMACAVKGYRCVFTMPDKMSKEKIEMLKAYGAEVVITRTDLEHDHPESYVMVAKRIAKETSGGFYTDQYYNMANPEAHYLTTGPEIWADTDGTIDALVHSLAYADRDDLSGRFLDTSREGFKMALDVSAYSLVALTRAAVPLMPNGGSVLTMTYYGSEKVSPHYNVMGVAKAALESCVRYLANDLGPQGIRVNAISAGPIKTLAASGVAGLGKLLRYSEKTAPLRTLVTPEDVGNAALWLLSDWSRAVTGGVVYVDAGWKIMGLTVPFEELD